MTLGGFEKNPELHQNYFNRPYIYPLGSDMNTGDDNSEMLPWATVADTIEELGEKMGMENLAAQVEEYNGFVRDGKDPRFLRDPEQMAEIKTGPFYCLKCVPAVYNTQGGARRNAIKQAVRNAIAQAEQA